MLMTIAQGALYFSVGAYCGIRFSQWVTRQVKKNKATDDLTSRKDWHAMPCGRRLELGASGYYIEISGAGKSMQYEVFDPEDRQLAGANALKLAKQFCEERAAEREEFSPVKGRA